MLTKYRWVSHKAREVPFNLVAWVSSLFCFVFGFKDTNLLKPRRLSLTIWVIAGICSCRNSAAELSQHLVFIADFAPSMQPSTTHQKVQQNQFWWWHCIEKFEGPVNRNPFSTNPVSWRQPVCLPYLPGVCPLMWSPLCVVILTHKHVIEALGVQVFFFLSSSTTS